MSSTSALWTLNLPGSACGWEQYTSSNFVIIIIIIQHFINIYIQGEKSDFKSSEGKSKKKLQKWQGYNYKKKL